MKKLFILIAAIPFLANAQEPKKGKANKNISIGFSFSPDYNFRTLRNNDGSSSSEMVIDQRNNLEKGKFSFTTGVNLNVRVSGKLEFQTGLLYSNKGYRTPKRATDFQSPLPDEPTHIKSDRRFNYLDIPLKLNFVSGGNKIRFIAGAGIAANIFLDESDIVTLFYASGNEKEMDQSSGFDYNKFNLSSLLSAGIEFKLKKNLFFRVEPTFRYGLLKIIDQPVTAHLWNFGVGLGVYGRLK
jgi:hypothetical protein